MKRIEFLTNLEDIVEAITMPHPNLVSCLIIEIIFIIVFLHFTGVVENRVVTQRKNSTLIFLAKLKVNCLSFW